MISKLALLRGFGLIRLLAMLLAALPLLALPILGLAWIWMSEHRSLWLAAMGGFAVAGYGLHLFGIQLERSRNREHSGGKSRQAEPHATTADPNWPPRDEACWEKVEKLAQGISSQDWKGLDVQRIALLGRDTLDVVAGHYHPEAEKPLLELTIPHALLIIERAARDLRQDILNTIPLSHQLTVGFLLRINRWKETAQQYEKLYRFGRAVFSPYSALFHEVRRKLGNNIAGYGLESVKSWLLREYVRKVGFYAIELYSGKLLLSEDSPLSRTTVATRKDLINQSATQDSFQHSFQDDSGAKGVSDAPEPLRILVVGRANVGKSSLINALFGRLTVVTDALPGTTRAMRAYRLQRDGRDEALILDAPGCDTDLLPATVLRQAVLDADLILWVTAANRADRHVEREQLDQIRSWYAERPARRLPPLVVVVSHIDMLRPIKEWDPPYDLNEPDGPKAAIIRAATEAVARDLNVPQDLTIPVCLAQDRLYNVEDTLAAVILELQDESEKARFLRCLEARKKEESWGNVVQQLKAAGRLLGDRVLGAIRK